MGRVAEWALDEAERDYGDPDDDTRDSPAPGRRPGKPADSEERMARPNGPPCPKCGKPSWDNRNNKRNPKAPDFKCAESCTDDKNPELTYGWWDDDDKPAKGGKPSGKPAAKPAAAPNGHGVTDRGTWATFARTYQRCRDVALASWKGVDGVDLVAATATLFIQAERMGLAVEPEPVKKPRAIEQMPEALDEEEEDLPY